MLCLASILLVHCICDIIFCSTFTDGLPRLSEFFSPASSNYTNIDIVIDKKTLLVDEPLQITKETTITPDPRMKNFELIFVGQGSINVVDTKLKMTDFTITLLDTSNSVLLSNNSCAELNSFTVDIKAFSTPPNTGSIMEFHSSNASLINFTISSVLKLNYFILYFITSTSSKLFISASLFQNLYIMDFVLVNAVKSILQIQETTFRKLTLGNNLNIGWIMSDHHLILIGVSFENSSISSSLILQTGSDLQSSGIATVLILSSKLYFLDSFKIDTRNSFGFMTYLNGPNTIISIQECEILGTFSNRLFDISGNLNFIFTNNKILCNCYSGALLFLEALDKIEVSDSKFAVNNKLEICNEYPLTHKGILITIHSSGDVLILNNLFSETYSEKNVAVITFKQHIYLGILSKVIFSRCKFETNIVKYDLISTAGTVINIETTSMDGFLIDDCHFEENQLLSDRFLDKVGGPCIYSTVVNVMILINRTNFTKNKSSFDSNCIQAEYGSLLLIQNCLFDSNAPPTFFLFNILGTAGVIHSSFENLTVINSTFERNSNHKAGAIFFDGNKKTVDSWLTMLECNFSENRASRGGALSIGQMVVNLQAWATHCLFSKNKAELGGAIYTNFDSEDAKVFINESQLVYNIADFGGAIACEHKFGAVYIMGSYFYANEGTFANEGGYLMHNVGGGACIIINGRSSSNVISLYNLYYRNKAFYTGGVFGLTSGNFTDVNSSFKENSAYDGAIGVVILYAQVTLKGSILTGNEGRKTGSGLKCSFVAFVRMIGVVFENNTTPGSYGFITTENDSYLILFQIKFRNNSANANTFLVANRIDNGIIQISEIEIVDCFSQGAFISVVSSKNIIIESVKFVTNSGRFLDSFESRIVITNLGVSDIICSFVQSPGCVASISKGSSTEITNITVYNITHNKQGAFIYIQDSNITVVNASAKFIISSEGAVCIKGQSSNISLSDTFFQIFNEGCLHLTLSSVELKNNTITRMPAAIAYSWDQDYLASSSALTCQDCSYLKIHDSFFYGNKVICDYGGAVALISEIEDDMFRAFITRTVFQANYAFFFGGALLVKNKNLEVLNCSFSENKAKIGGAFYFDNSVYSMNSVIFHGNEFKNNQADIEGGVFKFISKEPLFISNSVESNTAEFYGDNIASFPLRMRLFLKKRDDKNSEFIDIRRILNDSNSSCFEMDDESPGQQLSYELLFQLVDLYGEVVKSISEKLVILSIELNRSMTGGSNNTVIEVKGDISRTIIRGQFTVENLIISSKPAANNATLLITTPEINSKLYSYYVPDQNCHEIIKNEKYFYVIPIKLRECRGGEVYDEFTMVCRKCEYGKFSLNPNDKECSVCPAFAKCPGGNKLILDAGYWRTNNDSAIIHLCDPYPESCLGGESGLCKLGYTGPLCQTCESKEGMVFSKNANYECTRCDGSTEMAIFQGLLLVVGTIIFIWILIWANINDLRLLARYSLKKESHPSINKRNNQVLNKICQSILLKIFVNYVQLISISKTLNLNWPSEISSIFKIHGGFGQIADDIFSIECFISPGLAIPFIYLKAIFISASPFFFLAFIALFWLVKYFATNLSQTTHLICSFVIFFMLLQPMIVSFITRPLACRELEKEAYYMIFDMTLECYTAEHLKYIFFLILPTVFIWVVLIPFILFFVLAFNRKELETQTIRNKLGFIYYGYKIEYFYWEFVVMFRKISIIFIVQFYKFNTVLKVLYIILILSLSLVLQMKRNPFYTNFLNDLESYSIFLSIMTLLFALIYHLNDNMYMRLSLFLLVSIGNGVFLLFFLKKVIEINKDIVERILLCLHRKRKFKAVAFKPKSWLSAFISTISNSIQKKIPKKIVRISSEIKIKKKIGFGSQLFGSDSDK